MTPRDKTIPNYFRVFCIICSRGCEHQLPPCICHHSTDTQSPALAGSCCSSGGMGQGSGRPPPAATSLAGGSEAVCQGWLSAPAAACSRHRVLISSSCLTWHRSLRGLKARRRLICGENAASQCGRKPFLKHKLPPRPLQVFSLATRVKVFLPMLFPTPHAFLIFSLPPKDSEGCCLWDKSVFNKVWGANRRESLPPPQSSPSLLQNLCFCISRIVFACRDEMLPCHTPYTTLFLWHSVARITEYRNSFSRVKQDRKREIFILSPHNFSKAPYRSFILNRCLHPSQLHKAHTHILRWFAEL